MQKLIFLVTAMSSQGGNNGAPSVLVLPLSLPGDCLPYIKNSIKRSSYQLKFPRTVNVAHTNRTSQYTCPPFSVKSGNS